MTCEEIYIKYIDLFKLLIKNAGIETGNTSYRNVDKILEQEDDKRCINRAIEDEVDFRIFVSILIFRVMIDIHGIEKLEKLDEDKMKDLITSLYVLYLLKPTRKFCTRYGLPVFNDPEITAIVRRKMKFNREDQ